MAGVCILCNNLEGKNLNLNDDSYEVCYCKLGKFNVDKVETYFSRLKVISQCKSVKEIQEQCDSWDDRLKPKAQS